MKSSGMGFLLSVVVTGVTLIMIVMTVIWIATGGLTTLLQANATDYSPKQISCYAGKSELKLLLKKEIRIAKEITLFDRDDHLVAMVEIEINNRTHILPITPLQRADCIGIEGGENASEMDR